MIVVLSPSKTLDDASPVPKALPHSLPGFLEDTQILIAALRRYSPQKLSALMGISDKLAALNTRRYQEFTLPFTVDNARQAILTFKGDVYEGMEVAHYTKKEFAFAQEHVRILSGLYGVLKPLDLIQPYRLEMGTKLATKRGKHLYAFWGKRITEALNAALAQQAHPVLVNLASEEYFKAVRADALEGRLITVVFKENHKGSLKVIGLFAKRARGMMADFMVREQLDDPEGLKAFRKEGYRFEKSLSGDGQWVFVR